MDCFWQEMPSKLEDVKLPKLLIFSTQNLMKHCVSPRRFLMTQRIWLHTEHLKETFGKESHGINGK